MKIDRYFMTRDAPNGSLRRFDLKKMRTVLIGAGAVILLILLALPNERQKTVAAAVSVSSNTSASQTSASLSSRSSKDGEFYLSNLATTGSSDRYGTRNRQLSASQLVSAEGGGFAIGLASGTSLSAKIVNRVVTSDARSPVIAVITSTSADSGGGEIPVGTKVLGTAEGSSGSDRVQIAFYTMVFESGREISFNGQAVMPDGSSGIAGDYHSQLMKKEGGRFLSHFAAGFAKSYKDKEPGGVFAYEPGNLKNAALGGVAESASEQAKSYGEEMKNVRPFVSVDPGTPFLIFLDKGLKL